MLAAEFKAKLQECSDNNALTDLCRVSVLHGTPYVFREREEQYYSFRKRIAEKFEISFHEVYIVGSAKTGFSPRKGYKPFDLDSDVDIAIVSPNLFSSFMKEVYRFQWELRLARTTVTTSELKQYHRFLEYIALGWIRPDKLPLAFDMEKKKKDWFEFFASISNGHSEVGNYEVSAGIFKDYDHLERYTILSMGQLKSLEMVRT